MPATLDEIFVPACRQVLGALDGVLKKGRRHAEAMEIDEQEVLGLRINDSMWPLPNQIQSVWAHSAYAIDRAKTGAFSPNTQGIPTSWDEMHAMLDSAHAQLSGLEPGELEKIAETRMQFVMGGQPRLAGSVADFLLSFHLPNVYFHATTAYNILRMQGVEVGKFDYLGQMRLQRL